MKQPIERMNQFIHPRDGTIMTSDEIMKVIEKRMLDGGKYSEKYSVVFCQGMQTGIMLADMKYMEMTMRNR